MAGSLASINIKFFADLKQFRSEMQNAAREANKASQQFSSVGQNMTIGITAPILAMGGAALKTYGDIDALERGLTSVEGSAELAGAEFENLIEVAKLPGLGLEEAARGSVNLQAAGFSADEARQSLLAFGNALATVGKGKRELDLVTLALTQLNNKSGGFGQDLRQLTEQLPQLRGALTNAFGTADSDEIAKMGVTGKEVVQLLTKEFLKLPKVTGGFNNAVENASDSIKITLAGLGESINKSLNIEGLINSFAESLSELAQQFKELTPTTQKFILSAVGIAAAIGPVLIGLGGVLKIVPLVTTAVAALGSAMTFLSAHYVAVAAAATVAFAIYKVFTEKTKELTSAQKEQARNQAEITKLNDEATRSIVKQRLKLDELVLTARNANKPMSERKKAIEEINKVSPEYLGNLTLETIRTDEATTAINKYNEALFKGALARAAQSKIDANAERRINAQLKFEQQTYEFNKKKNAAMAEGWAEFQKFSEAENANQAMALIRYEDKMKLLDEEDKRLVDILNNNKSYLGLLKDQGEAAVANSKIETPEQRAKITTILETVQAPDLGSSGTLAAYDAQIAKLRELQTEVAVTSDMYYDIETAIAQLELEKEIKFDLPNEELNNFSDNFRNFGQKFKDDAAAMQARAAEFSASVGQSIERFLEDSVAGFAEFIGQLAVGKASLGDLFAGMASLVADFVINIGKSLIAVGVAGVAFQSSLSNPVAALAAGAVVVAAGSAFKAIIGSFNDAGAFAGGGIVGGSSYSGDRLFARVNSGEMILNERQQRNLWGMINPAVSAQDVAIQMMGNFEVSGSSLRLVLDRADNNSNRTR